MLGQDEELIQRKKTSKMESKHIHSADYNISTSEEPNLTLMEEVLLLGLKEHEGYTSFWNDSISFGLRACILVELGLRKRIKLEDCGIRKRSLLRRKVIVINDEVLDDIIADEALKLIKSLDPPESVSSWLDYLNGESWNPFKFKYQMRNVRERLAKNLVEKGILTTSKKNFLFFDMTIHPIVDGSVKSNIIKKIHDALLTNWPGDPFRIDKRTLALILLANVSEVLSDTLNELNDQLYDKAINRVAELKNLDFQKQAYESGDHDVLWAVLTLICK